MEWLLNIAKNKRPDFTLDGGNFEEPQPSVSQISKFRIRVAQNETGGGSAFSTGTAHYYLQYSSGEVSFQQWPNNYFWPEREVNFLPFPHHCLGGFASSEILLEVEEKLSISTICFFFCGETKDTSEFLLQSLNGRFYWGWRSFLREFA